MSECKICTIHQSQNDCIKKGTHWILRHSEKEKNCQGYLYLEPIQHKEKFLDFTPEEWSEHSVFLSKAFEWIYSKYNPKKIYIVTISEQVPHIHFHIVPRYEDTTKGLPYLELALSGKLSPQ
jgi:diadenosine tetraphosphate (Ap4A) HIT family hydrolase